MDINANDNPNEIDYAKVPLSAMRQAAKTILSRSLNPTKVLLSEEGIQRDWRGIAYLAGLCSLYEPFMQTEQDPINKVLSLWRHEGDNQTANFDNLLKFLGKIDRWDVADDLAESLAEDAKVFKSKKYQEDLIISRREASAACDKFDKDTCGNYSQDILTTEDAKNAELGLPPQMYDAFVLFADEDYDFATHLIERLEENHPKFNFKICVKDRDLIGGIAIEHEAILRIISERCERLILIVSNAFFKSPAETFFMNFAAALQIEKRRMKILPCLIEPCELPPPLAFYSNLKYFHDGKLINFWDKLSSSIRSPVSFSSMNRVRAIQSPSPNIQIEEIKELPSQKSITSDTPIKFPRKKAYKVPDSLNIPSEPRLQRNASSMNHLNSLTVTDNNDNYRSEFDLSSLRSLDTNFPELSSSTKSSSRRSGKTKWYNAFLSKFSSSGSKLDLPVTTSISIESVEKPKRKKNWLKKKLASEAT